MNFVVSCFLSKRTLQIVHIKWELLSTDIGINQELHVEIFLRHVIETLDPNDIPDLISAFAKENFRLVKIINQAGDHIDKIDPKSSSPKSKRNPSPRLPH